MRERRRRKKDVSTLVRTQSPAPAPLIHPEKKTEPGSVQRVKNTKLIKSLPRGLIDLLAL